MVSTRHVLTVFMASPGDVDRERSELAAVVNRINRRFARELGWLIELRGWEDTVPGVGRPQSRINPEVDACDVFIGILWRRWGTPTGEETSGFYEEFQLARKRRASDSPDPEIMMYFRSVDAGSRSDPGEQLQKVMGFKEELTASREVLYTTYDKVDDFVSLVEDHLTKVLYERASAAASSPAGAGGSAPQDGDETEIASDDVQRFADAGPLDLSVLLGNPYLSPTAAIERWAAAARARDISLAPCAVGSGELWSFDPFDPEHGLSLIVGKSGSGKSNAILAMAFSLVFSLAPELLRFSILDLEAYQSVGILEAIGATRLPARTYFDTELVLEEARRREERLTELGFDSMRRLWRYEPALRAEFPVWVICADEALQLVRNPEALDRLVAVAGRVAGLGIHFVLGSQVVGSLGELALATRAKRIALSMFNAQEHLDFTGVADPFGAAGTSRPGLAVCAEGNTVRPLRFALVDDRSLAEVVLAASREWGATR